LTLLKLSHNLFYDQSPLEEAALAGKTIEVSNNAEMNKNIVGQHRKEEQIKNIDHQDGKKIIGERENVGNNVKVIENVGNNVNEEKVVIENDEKMEKSEKNLNQ